MDEQTDANWSRRLLVAGGIVAAVLLGGLIASATIPRWWAQRIGEQVDGSIVTGTFVGLFYGFVFTALPFLVLAAVAMAAYTAGDRGRSRHRARSSRSRT